MWWSKQTEDFSGSPFKDDERPLPLIKPKIYYVMTILINWKNGKELKLTEIISLEEKRNLVTCTFNDPKDPGPSIIFNEFGTVARPNKKLTFNTNMVNYWEITDSDLRINEDGK